MHSPEPTRDLASEASARGPLGLGECLGLVALILLPVVGFAGLVLFSVTSGRSEVRALARAALSWHVLLWSALAIAVLYFAVRLGTFISEVLSQLGPVR